jgi:DNA-binding MarR family transcriptional regulator
MAAGKLAELIRLTTGAIARVIDRLETGSYVRCERDLHDRRSVFIRLQPKMADIDALVKRYLKQAWSDL